MAGRVGQNGRPDATRRNTMTLSHLIYVSFATLAAYEFNGTRGLTVVGKSYFRTTGRRRPIVTVVTDTTTRTTTTATAVGAGAAHVGAPVKRTGLVVVGLAVFGRGCGAVTTVTALVVVIVFSVRVMVVGRVTVAVTTIITVTVRRFRVVERFVGRSVIRRASAVVMRGWWWWWLRVVMIVVVEERGWVLVTVTVVRFFQFVHQMADLVN